MVNFYEMTKIVESYGAGPDGMFSYGGHVDRRFAMAVYSVMHNRASAVDWEIIDGVPKDKALSWVREFRETIWTARCPGGGVR